MTIRCHRFVFFKERKDFFKMYRYKANIILIDIKFFINNYKVFIRTIITLITVSDLNAQKYSIDKYVIAFMYFSDIND